MRARGAKQRSQSQSPLLAKQRSRSQSGLSLGCLIALLLALIASPIQAETIPVVLAPTAPANLRPAAEELATTLARLYPADRFELAQSLPDQGRAIVLEPDGQILPEGFRVGRRTQGPLELGTIQASDARGMAYGVARLLERLGCGFYLSFETLPPRKAFSFDAWDLSARPLARDRVVFNWHNFLSGCSTWDAPEWKAWIARSRRMGFNGVMVHAYGNNPMAGFAFQDQWKPVGFLSSTRIGRDWSVNHVNDVRRLWGGDVFDSPVFGSQAAVDGSDEQRTLAARRLMAEAFAEAQRLAMNVFFAVDIDTATANPQELVLRLPESSRFQADDMWLPRPDTPEGYALYKAEVAELLAAYPQITVLVAWHRAGKTPWMSFQREAMPRAWQDEFAAACTAQPGTAELWHAEHLFAQSKIVVAMRRALDELGRRDVRLALGSWNFAFLPAAHRFLSPEVMLIGLDATVLRNDSVFHSGSHQAEVAAVAVHRPVLPVAWAHHDDGNYVGRPYTPCADFHDQLGQMGCGSSGFGIIHWTTRPLDLFFRSLVNQVWSDRENEALEATCRRMAIDCVGFEQGAAFGDYLHDWVTTMPIIARETSDFFVDVRLELTPELETAFARRAARLQALDQTRLTPSARDWVRYFQGLEQYIHDIYRNESRLLTAADAWSHGRPQEARQTIAECRPEEVVQRFAEFSRLGGISRGEQGLVVTMNTRWLTHYERVRQAFGLEPVRICYAATSHDLLAQSRGKYTFHFDAQHRIWETQGQAETGGMPFALASDVTLENPQGLDPSLLEVCREGITSTEPIDLTIAPIFPREKLFRQTTQLPAGAYRLQLLMAEPSCEAPGQRVFEVAIETAGPKGETGDLYEFSPVHAKALRIVCRGSQANDWNSICEVRVPGQTINAKRVKASAECAKENEAAKAFDDDPKTRWAARGGEHWLECRLDPAQAISQVVVQWFEGARRTYDYDLLVTQDGRTWEKLAWRKTPVTAELARRKVDLFAEAGARHRAVALAWPVRLDRPGSLRVRLTSIQGPALICGAVLTPE